jgi:hypothetical protein
VDDNVNWFLSEKGRDRLLMLPGTEVPVVEALNEGIIVAAADNRILYANPAAERLLGWRPEDLVERPSPCSCLSGFEGRTWRPTRVITRLAGRASLAADACACPVLLERRGTARS